MPEPVAIESLKRADEAAESMTDRVLVECFTALTMELAETNESLGVIARVMRDRYMHDMEREHLRSPKGDEGAAESLTKQ